METISIKKIQLCKNACETNNAQEKCHYISSHSLKKPFINID